MKRAILAVACALVCAAPAQAAELDLETLDGPTAVKLMDEGKLTSVELTRAYIARIAALQQSGPGLNAVSQLNEDALQDAALLDKERREGRVRGPAHGLPVLLQGPDRRQGHVHLGGQLLAAQLLPGDRLGCAKHLRRERGVVILGKLGPLRVRQLLRFSAVGLREPHGPGAATASTPTRTRAGRPRCRAVPPPLRCRC